MMAEGLGGFCRGVVAGDDHRKVEGVFFRYARGFSRIAGEDGTGDVFALSSSAPPRPDEGGGWRLRVRR